MTIDFPTGKINSFPADVSFKLLSSNKLSPVLPEVGNTLYKKKSSHQGPLPSCARQECSSAMKDTFQGKLRGVLDQCCLDLSNF